MPPRSTRLYGLFRLFISANPVSFQLSDMEENIPSLCELPIELQSQFHLRRFWMRSEGGFHHKFKCKSRSIFLLQGIWVLLLLSKQIFAKKKKRERENGRILWHVWNSESIIHKRSWVGRPLRDPTLLLMKIEKNFRANEPWLRLYFLKWKQIVLEWKFSGFPIPNQDFLEPL